MTIFLILVFLCLFTIFAFAVGAFVIVLDESPLRMIFGYIFFLVILAIPTIAVGYLVWQRLVL